MSRTPEQLPTIVIDTREQTPWSTTVSHAGKRIELPFVRGKVESGDYTVEGHESEISIERKSLGDWVGTLFGEYEGAEGVMLSSWDRFNRELLRASSLQLFAVIVEASREDVYAHAYRSRVHPHSVIGRSDSILVDFGRMVIWAGDRAEANRLGMWILHRWWLNRHPKQSELVEADVVRPVEAPKRFAPAGGMTASSKEFADRRAARKRTA